MSEEPPRTVGDYVANLLRGSEKQTRRGTISIDAYIEQVSTAETGDVMAIAGLQIGLLSAYYKAVLEQAERSFNWALVATGFGLLFFFGAVGFLLAAQPQFLAVVSVIGGAVVEVIAGVNFYLYAKTTSQLASYHRRLDQTQRLLLANSICEQLPGDERSRTRAELVSTIAEFNLGSKKS